MSTLNDMIVEMRNHGFEDTDAPTLTAFLNDAYEDVWGREAWPFRSTSASVSIIAGNDTPTMPTDFGKVDAAVIDLSGVVLTPVDMGQLTKDFTGALTTVGVPIYYYFIGNTFKVWPIPDTNYTMTLRYVKAFTPLALSTDSPALPNNHRVIVLGALASAYDMEDDTDLALRFEGRFNNRIATVREEWWAQQYDRPKTLYDLAEWDEWGG